MRSEAAFLTRSIRGAPTLKALASWFPQSTMHDQPTPPSDESLVGVTPTSVAGSATTAAAQQQSSEPEAQPTQPIADQSVHAVSAASPHENTLKARLTRAGEALDKDEFVGGSVDAATQLNASRKQEEVLQRPE